MVTDGVEISVYILPMCFLYSITVNVLTDRNDMFVILYQFHECPQLVLIWQY
jgi:hypothetical protein